MFHPIIHVYNIHYYIIKKLYKVHYGAFRVHSSANWTELSGFQVALMPAVLFFGIEFKIVWFGQQKDFFMNFSSGNLHPFCERNPVSNNDKVETANLYHSSWQKYSVFLWVNGTVGREIFRRTFLHQIVLRLPYCDIKIE